MIAREIDNARNSRRAWHGASLDIYIEGQDTENWPDRRACSKRHSSKAIPYQKKHKLQTGQTALKPALT